MAMVFLQLEVKQKSCNNFSRAQVNSNRFFLGVENCNHLTDYGGHFVRTAAEMETEEVGSESFFPLTHSLQNCPSPEVSLEEEKRPLCSYLLAHKKMRPHLCDIL